MLHVICKISSSDDIVANSMMPAACKTQGSHLNVQRV